MEITLISVSTVRARTRDTHIRIHAPDPRVSGEILRQIDKSRL